MFVLLFFFCREVKKFIFCLLWDMRQDPESAQVVLLWRSTGFSLPLLCLTRSALSSLTRCPSKKKKRPGAYFLRYRAKSCFWDASGGISRIPLNGRDQLWQPECGTDVPSRIFGVKVNFGVKDVVYNIMLNISDGLHERIVVLSGV